VFVARSPYHTPAVAVRTLPVAPGVRLGPDGPWTPVDPAAARVAGGSAAGGWGDLLTRDPHPELDGAGRIRRFRLTTPDGGSLDVRLSDFGTPVDLAPPP
jgi:hypothetical protein